MTPKRSTPKRGRMFSFRLREDSEKRLDELAEYRCMMNHNANKCDILSQAIDELYYKELPSERQAKARIDVERSEKK